MPNICDVSAMAGGDEQQTQSGGFSETWEHALQPSFYGTLRPGGTRHNRMVDMVVYATGRMFQSTGQNWMIITRRQTP